MGQKSRRPLQLSDRGFNRAVVTMVALGFVALIIAGGSAGWVMLRTQEHTRWVVHTYQVENRIAGYRLRLERMETARRGYLLNAEPRFRDVFVTMRAELPPQVDAIAALTMDNTRQQANVARLRAMTAHVIADLTRSVATVDAGNPATALAEFRSDRSVDQVLAIRRLAEAMVAEEERLLTRRDAEQRGSARLFYVVLAVAAVLLVMLAIGSLVLIVRYTRDLAASRDALAAMNDTLEDAVRVRTTDLQRANDEIQRFAYIVSHDLRSPLVNVLGFTAELDAALKSLARLIARADEEAPGLVDQDARLAVTEDIPEAIGFIRVSTQKMDRLINAILKLSREGRRTIAPERIDMTALAQSVSDSIAHRVTELGARIVVEAPLPGIVSDRLAVEQILSNLVENAVKYLQPGRPGVIRIGAIRDATRVIFSVADNGRGIDPRDHDRVFDLFRRSGVQDQPGEGIGLAHVRAMAYRLGGTVDCVSRLGEGATFRLSLPEIFSGERKALS